MSSKISIQVSGRTDVGRKRSNNQDSFLVMESVRLFAVADGMGGHSGGEVASALAVKTLEKVFSEPSQHSYPVKLEQSVMLANRVIFDQSSQNAHLNGMGTTLTAAVMHDDWLYIAQVGDSRLYLYREGLLYQLTEDHSQVYELIKAGIISDANAGVFQKNVITRSVGYERTVNVDMCARKVMVGDIYLMCSDGLSGMVSNEQIAQILQNFSIDQAVNNLIELANFNGGEDNISVIVFEVG